MYPSLPLYSVFIANYLLVTVIFFLIFIGFARFDFLTAVLMNSQVIMEMKPC